MYSESYTRSDAVAFVNTLVGSLEEKSSLGWHKHMTGYDICDYIRRWLQAQGKDMRSACEVILLDRALLIFALKLASRMYSGPTFKWRALSEHIPSSKGRLWGIRPCTTWR